VTTSDKHLRFLADECCDFAVVRALRAEGYDVFAVGEVMQHSVDRSLIELAAEGDRILLTEDKDFGWLVYVGRASSAGVILIRYPGNARKQLAEAIVRLVQTQGEQLRGNFVVLQPGQARINRRN
jgi:predicted nuclease of predicted toxin-antitoxin system